MKMFASDSKFWIELKAKGRKSGSEVMMSTQLSRFLKISVLVLFCLISPALPLNAQINDPAETDTLDNFSQQLSYEIKLLQLQTIWPQILNKQEFPEIVELKLFSEQSAEEKDYSLALIYLDEIFTILNRKESQNTGTEEPSLQISPSGESVSVFQQEVLTGMDFSRQEYHMTYDVSDTAYIETINNPYGGLKLGWNQYLLNDYDLELNGLFKYSRDYSIWQANAQFEKSNVSGFTFQLIQQGEGMKYKNYFDMQYWQSLSDFRIDKKLSDFLSLQFENEFQFRNYKEETESFASYWRNDYQVLLRASNFWNSRFLLSFEKDQRRQKTFTVYDYDDRRLNLQHYFNPSWRTSFSGWYQFRTIYYPQATPDTSYVADYQQHFLSVNFKQNIQERIALRFFGEAYSRDYFENGIYWSDYYYFRSESGLRIEISDKLTFGVDYLIEVKRFQHDQNRDYYLFLNEDFLGEGVILSVDFFNFKNFLLSLNHTFRLNSYPNSSNDIFPGLSLYTDRKQNSTMLFLSYQLFSGLDIDLILQHDLDVDQEIQNNDSRSSIFSLDFTWHL